VREREREKEREKERESDVVARNRDRKWVRGWEELREGTAVGRRGEESDRKRGVAGVVGEGGGGITHTHTHTHTNALPNTCMDTHGHTSASGFRV